MKIRQGFVSNSSSSSFVAATLDKTNFKITIDVDLSKYVSDTLTTEEEVLHYFKYEYDYEDDSSVVLKALEAVRGGKKVLVGSFDDQSGDAMEYFLCMNGIPENTTGIDVIQSEGGY